jgi:hypothetical protein
MRRRIAALLVLATVISACAGAPAPTPIIVYVTPAPSVAPSPLASASSAPANDDAKITALIADTQERLKILGAGMSMGGSLVEKMSVLPDLRDLLERARDQLDTYRPSACLSFVTDTFRSGLMKTDDGVVQTLNAWMSGAPPPDVGEVITEGGAELSSAMTLAETKSCP